MRKRCCALALYLPPTHRKGSLESEVSRLNIQLSDSKGAPAVELALVQKRLAQVEAENMKLAGE